MNGISLHPLAIPRSHRGACSVAVALFIAGLLVFALQSSAVQKDGPTTPLKNVVFNMEHELATAEKQQNHAFFNRTMDKGLVYVAYNGLVFDKAKLLSSMKYVDVNRYSMENFKVRELGPDAALVTYDLKINADVAGKQLPEKQYASSIWLHTGEGWKLIFHQATPAHHR
ncbi:MAG: DUF4440 domain-containing protein [Candidatus Angelobacter sp.]